MPIQKTIKNEGTDPTNNQDKGMDPKNKKHGGMNPKNIKVKVFHTV